MNCNMCLWHFRVELISICFRPRINEPPMMANRMVICLASLSPSCGWKLQKLGNWQKCKWQPPLQKKNSCKPFVDIFCEESNLTWPKQDKGTPRFNHCNDSTHSTHSTLAFGTTKGHTICTSRSCASGPKCCLAASMAISTNTTPDIELMHHYPWTQYLRGGGYLRVTSVTSIYLYHVYLYCTPCKLMQNLYSTVKLLYSTHSTYLYQSLCVCTFTNCCPSDEIHLPGSIQNLEPQSRCRPRALRQRRKHLHEQEHRSTPVHMRVKKSEVLGISKFKYLSTTVAEAMMVDDIMIVMIMMIQ